MKNSVEKDMKEAQAVFFFFIQKEKWFIVVLMFSVSADFRLLNALLISSSLAFLSACSDDKPAKPDTHTKTTATQRDDDPDDDSSDKPKDFASIAKSLSALQSRGAQGGEAVDLLADALEISPKQAAEWAATLPPGLNKDACLEIIFKGWAQEAPKDAAQFAKTHLKGVDYRLALASVVEGAASSSPETAAALLASENEPLLRGALIDSLVSGAIDDNYEFLGEWAAALPPGNDRDIAISSLVEEWSTRRPVECEKWFTRTLTPEEKIEQAVILITNWASLNPREARSWVDSQTNPELKENASIALVESWAFVDPAAASQWAAGLQDPVLKKSALETVSAAWIVNDTSGAVEWASKLPDTSLQQTALQAAFERLAEESPAALEYWIQQNPKHPALIFAQTALAEQ
jgi:hypothetical protein